MIISEVDKDSIVSGVLKKGDFIYRINRLFIPSLEIFKIVDEKIRGLDRIQLFIERNGEEKSTLVDFDRNIRRR